MENQAEVLKVLEDFKSGQETALDFIFSKYKTLVVGLARRYFLLGAEQEDLIQEGMIGLYKACQTYSENVGASFKSFAYLCIKRQMQSAIKTANRQKNLVLNNALSLSSKNGIVFVQAENAGENEKIIYLPPLQNSPENQMIEEESYNEMVENIKKSIYDISVFTLGTLRLILELKDLEECMEKQQFQKMVNIFTIKYLLIFLKWP